ncbi:hypothetical protein DO62_6113 [Burkholderia pseudomallei]|nr:hypothetical protein DO62_6113 [Burkholderia pseudomallei]KGD23751.1 hypothetical protein DO70_5373 [Burkholderia pseudomallei]
MTHGVQLSVIVIVCDGTAEKPAVFWLFGRLVSVRRVSGAPWIITLLEPFACRDGPDTVPEATPPIDPPSSLCVTGMIVFRLWAGPPLIRMFGTFGTASGLFAMFG